MPIISETDIQCNSKSAFIDNRCLTELSDVKLVSVSDGDVLSYDNASSKWINTTSSSSSGSMSCISTSISSTNYSCYNTKSHGTNIGIEYSICNPFISSIKYITSSVNLFSCPSSTYGHRFCTIENDESIYNKEHIDINKKIYNKCFTKINETNIENYDGLNSICDITNINGFKGLNCSKLITSKNNNSITDVSLNILCGNNSTTDSTGSILKTDTYCINNSTYGCINTYCSRILMRRGCYIDNSKYINCNTSSFMIKCKCNIFNKLSNNFLCANIISNDKYTSIDSLCQTNLYSIYRRGVASNRPAGLYQVMYSSSGINKLSYLGVECLSMLNSNSSNIFDYSFSSIYGSRVNITSSLTIGDTSVNVNTPNFCIGRTSLNQYAICAVSTCGKLSYGFDYSSYCTYIRNSASIMMCAFTNIDICNRHETNPITMSPIYSRRINSSSNPVNEISNYNDYIVINANNSSISDIRMCSCNDIWMCSCNDINMNSCNTNFYGNSVRISTIDGLYASIIHTPCITTDTGAGGVSLFHDSNCYGIRICSSAAQSLEVANERIVVGNPLSENHIEIMPSKILIDHIELSNSLANISPTKISMNSTGGSFTANSSTCMKFVATTTSLFSSIQEMCLSSVDRISLCTQKVMMPSIPTTDPVVAGQVWNDNGTLKISAG